MAGNDVSARQREYGVTTRVSFLMRKAGAKLMLSKMKIHAVSPSMFKWTGC